MSYSFDGIPRGRVSITPIPNLVFAELLPEIDDLSEMKITLHVLYVLAQRKNKPRYVRLEELLSDNTLMRSLFFQEKELRKGLTKAVARGSLLRVATDDEEVFFFNTQENQSLLDNEELVLSTAGRSVEAPVSGVPNIFKLYEQNIGVLTPLVIEELKEAETDIPTEWFEEAFRIAVVENKRNWRYVRAILYRWAREGKDEKIGRDNQKHRTWYNDDESKFFGS